MNLVHYREIAVERVLLVRVCRECLYLHEAVAESVLDAVLEAVVLQLERAALLRVELHALDVVVEEVKRLH